MRDTGMTRDEPQCTICKSKDDLVPVKRRLVLASSRADIESLRTDRSIPPQWHRGDGGTTLVCRACEGREAGNLALLKRYIAAGKVDYGNAIIRMLIRGFPGQARFLAILERHYAPESVESEALYAAAVCDKFWKMHLARQLYLDTCDVKPQGNVPVVSFAVMSFIIVAHSTLDSAACWLRDALGLQLALRQTGVYPKYRRFREQVGRKNAVVLAAIERADPWLKELDDRRNTVAHRSFLLPIYSTAHSQHQMSPDPKEEFFLGSRIGLNVTTYMDDTIRRTEALLTAVVRAVV